MTQNTKEKMLLGGARIGISLVFELEKLEINNIIHSIFKPLCSFLQFIVKIKKHFRKSAEIFENVWETFASC